MGVVHVTVWAREDHFRSRLTSMTVHPVGAADKAKFLALKDQTDLAGLLGVSIAWLHGTLYVSG